MKWLTLITTVLCLITWTACDKKTISHLSCKEFELNQPFTAKISDQWCLKGGNLRINLGPLVEDSRCNVPEIDCVWAGRYVMAATINQGGEVRDTFFAVHNWTDTLYHSAYQIILAKVYPEVRTSMEPLDPSLYAFDMIVK